MKRIITERELKCMVREAVETTIQCYRIDEQINSIILEELGIANEVAKLSWKVVGDIGRKWKVLKTNTSLNGLKYKYFNQTYTLLDKDIDFKVTIFTFNDLQDKQNHQKELDEYNWRNNRATVGEITLYLFAISGFLSKNSGELVQHEIEHYYQYLHSNKAFASNDFSDTFRTLLNDENPNIRDIGTILYLSRHYEQDGFSNGLYGLFKNNKDREIEDVLHDSEIYNNLMELQRIHKNFDSITSSTGVKDCLNRLYSDHRINRAKLFHFLNDAIKRIEWLIARTVKKYKKDMLTEGECLWISNPTNNSYYLLQDPFINETMKNSQMTL